MNGGNAMDFFFCKSSFQWSSINTDSLTGKAEGGTRPKVMRGARAETALGTVWRRDADWKCRSSKVK